MIFRSGIYNRSLGAVGEEIAGPEITREFHRKKRGRRAVSFSETLGSLVHAWIHRTKYDTRKYHLYNIVLYVSSSDVSFSIFTPF